MKIRNHRLVGSSGNLVPFEKSPNVGGNLNGGKPKILVIHYTAGRSASGAISTFKNPSSKVSAHLVIGHDGAITQMVEFDTKGWHAGKSRWKTLSSLNSHSVGIEIVNWGKLERLGNGGWRSWTGSNIPNERVILAEHKNHPGSLHGWEIFDEAQVESCIEAARAIVGEYGIGPSDVVGHDDISPSRKVDPGPAFDMDRFRARVFGREDDDPEDVIFAVRSATGLNMRTGPSIEHGVIKNLGDGTKVQVIEKPGRWWLVAELVNGEADTTGFVHSNWLIPE